MSAIAPTALRQKYKKTILIHAELTKCSHVFVRHLAIHHSLMCSYDEPFEVLSRKAKYFAIDIKGIEQNISIDCLKPAYVDLPTGASDLPIPSSTPTTTT